MSKIIGIFGLLLAVPFALLVFAELLDLNASVAPSGSADTLFDNFPQIFLFLAIAIPLTLLGGVILWALRR